MRLRILGLCGLMFSLLAVAQTPEEFFGQYGAGGRAFDHLSGAYWVRHIEDSRHAILEAAKAARGRSGALVLGAGKCREIPLEELARQFQRVTLVDLDQGSMEEAVHQLPAELRPKVEIRVADVTSFVRDTMERVRAAIAQSGSAAEAERKVQDVYAALERAEKQPPRLPPSDLVISSLVLSEIHHFPRMYTDHLIQQKFRGQARVQAGLDVRDERVRRFAVVDHMELLSRFCRPEGAIYFSDTIARGPVYEKIPAARKQAVLRNLLPELARRKFFQAVLDQTSARQTFLATFGVMRAQFETKPLPQEQLSALLERLSHADVHEEEIDAVAASEAALRMLGRGLLPAPTETAILERLLDLYREASPQAFEPLDPLDLISAQWSRRGLRQLGPPQEWWWLAYPTNIPETWGAMLVRSWTLKPTR